MSKVKVTTANGNEIFVYKAEADNLKEKGLLKESKPASKRKTKEEKQSKTTK